MRKIISLLFVFTLCLMMSACGEAEPLPEGSSVETAVTSEGEYDGGRVKILDAEWQDTEDDGNSLKVHFTYTNENSEPCYLYSAFAIRAFQNGVELDEIGLNDESEECQNLTVEVKDGASIDCAMIFALDSDDSVEVLVGTPTADEETVAQKEFSR